MLIPMLKPSGPVGRHYDPEGLLIPRISPDLVVLNPVRPIYHRKWAGQTLSMRSHSRKWRRHFCLYLKNKLFIQDATAEILSRRPASDIVRIIKNIECLLDNLILFDRTLFSRESEHTKFVLRIVQVTLRLSVYSITDQIEQWKMVVNHILNLASEAEVEQAFDLRTNAYNGW